MVAGCTNTCIKWLLFVFNFIFCALGAAIFGIALWVRLDNTFQQHLQHLIDNNGSVHFNINDYYVFLYLICAFGAILFFTGFLGCCGACCESTCLLALFFVILLILFVAELIVAIWFLVKRGDFEAQINSMIKNELIPKYESDKNVKDALDRIQTDFKCCGASGCEDYTSSRPASCSSSCDGCASKLYESIAKNFGLAAGIVIAVLAVELLGMIFAMVLCCSIRRGVAPTQFTSASVSSFTSFTSDERPELKNS